jgi:hypothetical protein
VRPSKVRRRLLIHSSYTTPRDTNIRIFNDLRGPVYEGRYDAVRRYAWTWQRDRTMSVDAYIPSGLAAGEAYQFDGSHHIVLINGTTAEVDLIRLCHSRMLLVRAYPRETQEMVLNARDRAFVLCKSAFIRGICDTRRPRLSFRRRRSNQVNAHILISSSEIDRA